MVGAWERGRLPLYCKAHLAPPPAPPPQTHPLLEHRHHAQSIIASKALDELETEVFETGLYENVDIHRGSRTSVLLAEIAYSESN